MYCITATTQHVTSHHITHINQSVSRSTNQHSTAAHQLYSSVPYVQSDFVCVNGRCSAAAVGSQFVVHNYCVVCNFCELSVWKLDRKRTAHHHITTASPPPPPPHRYISTTTERSTSDRYILFVRLRRQFSITAAFSSRSGSGRFCVDRFHSFYTKQQPKKLVPVC